MRRLLLLLVPALLLALSACGSADDTGSPASPAPSGSDGAGGSGGSGGSDSVDGDPAAGGIAQADNDLQVEIDLGDGTPVRTWTLTCVGFVEGSHPEAQAACDHLAGLTDPFAPLPGDQLCSQQWGGPQTAHVLGRWAGEPVDLELSRVDGCRIAQWDSLVPLVPAVDG